MIDEKQLIKDMKKLKRHYDFFYKKGRSEIDDVVKSASDTLFKDVIKTAQEQPKVGEWIPCSEYLPENKVNPISNDYYEYPVTVDFNGTLDVRYYKFGDGHWWHGGKCMDDYVIAWIPRPEPWEGEEDEI